MTCSKIVTKQKSHIVRQCVARSCYLARKAKEHQMRSNRGNHSSAYLEQCDEPEVRANHLARAWTLARPLPCLRRPS